MSKQISSYKNLNWEWSEEKQRFLIDLRPIGGPRRKPYQTKTEMWADAQTLFEYWRSDDVMVEVEEWTLAHAVEEYKAQIKINMLDPNERFGPKSYSTQCAQLDKIMALKFNGLTFGKSLVKNLSIEFMIDPFWPRLRDNMGPSQITGLNYYTTFKQFLGFCVIKKQIASNVAKDATHKSLRPRVKLPSRKKVWRERLQESVLKIYPLTIRSILDAVPEEHKSKVKFALRVGLRAGEQCALKVIDPKASYYNGNEGGIDFNNNRVIVRIAKKRGAKDSEDFLGECKSEQGWREIPISQKISSELKAEWDALPSKRKVEGWLFPTTHGTMGNPNNRRERILYAACDAIGLSKAERPRWHDLRHSYATALLNKRGADYTEAMELLGHADMSTTMMYKHIIRNPEKEKAIANDVDDYYDDLPSDGDPDNVVPFRKAG